MEHLEFQIAIDKVLKDILNPLIKIYKKYKIEIDNVRHNTYLTIKTGESMIKILIYQSGDISYLMWDSLCYGGTELFYYKYKAEDKHKKVISKFEKDFSTFLTMYFDNPSIHDLTELSISFENDNKKAFAEYKEISNVN